MEPCDPTPGMWAQRCWGGEKGPHRPSTECLLRGQDEGFGAVVGAGFPHAGAEEPGLGAKPLRQPGPWAGLAAGQLASTLWDRCRVVGKSWPKPGCRVKAWRRLRKPRTWVLSWQSLPELVSQSSTSAWMLCCGPDRLSPCLPVQHQQPPWASAKQGPSDGWSLSQGAGSPGGRALGSGYRVRR